jgi:predicted ATPase
VPTATPKRLDRVKVAGFRSFRALDLQLRQVNVLIGANGSGKSNFIDIFRLLGELVRGDLQAGVRTRGGADRLLYLGAKATPELKASFEFGDNAYDFTLKPTADHTLIFAEESGAYRSWSGHYTPLFGRGHAESQLHRHCTAQTPGIADWIDASLKSWRVYHFHDTSAMAGVRGPETTRDNQRLRDDARNLAPFLLHLRDDHPAVFEQITRTVRLAAPFFHELLLRPAKEANGDTSVLLEWRQPGSDYPFHPSQISDGTLRFICLTTALLQPDPPELLILDEPELGLHPYALSLLAELISTFPKQVIIATQSSTLLNHFTPEDIIVAARRDAETTLTRLNTAQLREWLTDYTLGELWEKDVIAAGPQREEAADG